MDENNLASHIGEAYRYYMNIGEVYCPAMDDLVIFNFIGFQHLVRRNRRKVRPLNECVDRLVYLRYVQEVVLNCEQVYEIRIHGNNIYRYALVYKVNDGVALRVVLQRIGTGKLIFLSVMLHR